jgi:phosphate transport system substrate-binding protein
MRTGASPQAKTLLAVLFCLVTQVLVAGERIVIGDTDAFGENLVPQLCAAYKALHPEVTFEIGSSNSVNTPVVEGLVDITTARYMPDREAAAAAKERGITFRVFTGARDVVAIVVRAGNPVTNLTRKQVEGIFAGEIANWREVGGRDLRINVTRHSSSEAHRTFRYIAMSNREDEPVAKRVPGSRAAASAVAMDEGAIGYVSLRDAANEKLASLTVDGISLLEPERYPYLMPLFYVTRWPPRQPVSDFLEWATKSPQALEIVRQAGLLPPPPERRRSR